MIFSLLKGRDTKRFITGNGELPVCHQFVPVNVNPDLHHPKLAKWKITGKKSSVVNGYRSLLSLVPHMNVRRMVLFGISIENGNQNSIEH
jgi:hypothetical protein